MLPHNNGGVFNKKIVNDQNNVHDRTVNELSKTYYNFLLKNTQIIFDIDDAWKDINNIYNDIYNSKTSLDNELVINYLVFITINNNLVLNFGCSEYDFFILCWNRIKMGVNEDNMHSLKMGMLENIVDCYITDYDLTNFKVTKKLCCLNGRVTKILSSFCYLDADASLGSFVSTDILKREFLNKASVVYSEGLTEYEYGAILTDIITQYNSCHYNVLVDCKKVILGSLIFSNS